MAAVVSSEGNDGGGSTTPALNSFEVTHLRTAPATLLLDANLAMRLDLTFDPGDGGGPRPMQHLTGPGVRGSGVDVTPGPNPALQWDFELDLGTSSLVKGVGIAACRGGSAVAGGEVTRDLGNDPPEILADAEGFAVGSVPALEVSDRARITFVVRDSSRDAVSIRFEFALADGLDLDAGELPPDHAFSPATPEGLVPIFVASDGGTSADFTWSSGADLARQEHDVVMRIIPSDLDDDGNTLSTGVSRATRGFRIDNNAAPSVSFDAAAPIDPDERRGIRIPFRVTDPENDLVEVILQWRHEGEPFPDLPLGDVAAVHALLADPVARLEMHVLDPYPHVARGRAIPVDATSLRLPELAARESWILASGLVGRTLEVLRPPSAPERITPTWSASTLSGPVAAVPVGDGSKALVLDGLAGGWRLQEIELASGVARALAAGSDPPMALCLEHGAEAALVASGAAGTWRIERVELATGTPAELIASDGTEPGPVRALASMGTHALLFTAGASVHCCDYRDPLEPRLARLLADLGTPWGLALDPLVRSRLYVSERDADRVLAVELRERGRLPVVVESTELLPETLAAPTALALERQGARLLALTDAPGGGRELRSIELGATGRNVSLSIGPVTADEGASLAAGPDGLRLLAIPSQDELLASGGLEQSRTILALDPRDERVFVDRPFAPAPIPGRFWRIPEKTTRLLLPGTPQGAPGSLLWDSRVAEGRTTFIRAVARDGEFGIAAESSSRLEVRSAFDVEPTDGEAALASDLDMDGDLDLLATSGMGLFQLSPGVFEQRPLLPPGSAAPASQDFDEDGDPDLVSARFDENDLLISYQLTAGVYGQEREVGGPGTSDGPVAVIAADLDSDGDMDLASANRTGDDLTVFLQDESRMFPATTLGELSALDDPAAIAVADLDGDGELDLVSANASSDDLTVFFQEGAGDYADVPLVLGGTSVTNGPRSVIAADLDADGDMDLASANLDSHDLTVFLQREHGVFADAPLVLGGFPLTNGPRSVAAGDVDGDGDMDLVCANRFGDDLAVFSQLSPGSFLEPPLVLAGDGSPDTDSLLLADVDGDGDLDIASEKLLLQDGPGSLRGTPLVLGNSSPAIDGPASLASADFDGDGNLDLVTANEDGNDLTLLLQVSPSRFASGVSIGGPSVTRGPSSVAAADLDGDGRPDLVSANQLGHDVTVFFQEASGFAAAQPVLGGLPTTIHPGTVEIADFDDDGQLDVVSANELFGNDLTIFHQVAPRTFEEVPLRIGDETITNLPCSLVVADLDLDGHADLVTANEFGSDLTIFARVAPRTYEPRTVGGVAITRTPLSVAVADIDGDGSADLVSANGDGNDLTVFLQPSAGTFAAPVVLGGFPFTVRPEAVIAADLDGDGDVEIASGNRFTNDVTVYFQGSPGSFRDAPLHLGGFPTTSRPRSIAAFDLDGDGDQDLVSANGNGDNLTVFFGGH